MSTAAPTSVSEAVVEPSGAALADERRRLLLARADLVSASPADPVPSPCISVCRINAASGLCEGCLRTLGEISRWARSGPVAQRALWQTLRQRAGVPADTGQGGVAPADPGAV